MVNVPSRRLRHRAGRRAGRQVLSRSRLQEFFLCDWRSLSLSIEDFEVGDIYRHPLGRTVTTTDNMWFSLLTQNRAPIHFDHHYAAQTEFGKPLVDSTFTLALVTGQSVTDVSQNVMANLGWDEVRLPNPVFEGDTIYSQSEVLDTRESRSNRTSGL